VSYQFFLSVEAEARKSRGLTWPALPVRGVIKLPYFDRTLIRSSWKTAVRINSFSWNLL